MAVIKTMNCWLFNHYFNHGWVTDFSTTISMCLIPPLQAPRPQLAWSCRYSNLCWWNSVTQTVQLQYPLHRQHVAANVLHNQYLLIFSWVKLFIYWFESICCITVPWEFRGHHWKFQSSPLQDKCNFASGQFPPSFLHLGFHWRQRELCMGDSNRI